VQILLSGKLIGTGAIQENYNSGDAQTVSCNLKKVAGVQDLFIRFTDVNFETLAWDKFQIE
jgi:hypothetical protein